MSGTSQVNGALWKRRTSFSHNMPLRASQQGRSSVSCVSCLLTCPVSVIPVGQIVGALCVVPMATDLPAVISLPIGSETDFPGSLEVMASGSGRSQLRCWNFTCPSRFAQSETSSWSDQIWSSTHLMLWSWGLSKCVSPSRCFQTTAVGCLHGLHVNPQLAFIFRVYGDPYI